MPEFFFFFEECHGKSANLISVIVYEPSMGLCGACMMTLKYKRMTIDVSK